jgi:hypothetical protein
MSHDGTVLPFGDELGEFEQLIFDIELLQSGSDDGLEGGENNGAAVRSTVHTPTNGGEGSSTGGSGHKYTHEFRGNRTEYRDRRHMGGVTQESRNINCNSPPSYRPATDVQKTKIDNGKQAAGFSTHPQYKSAFKPNSAKQPINTRSGANSQFGDSHATTQRWEDGRYDPRTRTYYWPESNSLPTDVPDKRWVFYNDGSGGKMGYGRGGGTKHDSRNEEKRRRNEFRRQFGDPHRNKLGKKPNGGGGGKRGVGVTQQVQEEILNMQDKMMGDRDAYKEKLADLAEEVKVQECAQSHADFIRDQVREAVRIGKQLKVETRYGSVVEWIKRKTIIKIDALAETLSLKALSAQCHEYLGREVVPVEIYDEYVFENVNGVPTKVPVTINTPPHLPRIRFKRIGTAEKKSPFSKIYKALASEGKVTEGADILKEQVEPLYGDFSYEVLEWLPGDDRDMRPESMSQQDLKHMDAQYAVVDMAVQVRGGLTRLYKKDQLLVSFELMSQIMAADTLCVEVTEDEMYSRLLHRARTCHTVNINRFLSLSSGIDVVENTCRLAFGLWADRQSKIVKDFRMKGATERSQLLTGTVLVK